MTHFQGTTNDEIWDATDHKIKSMHMGDTAGLRTKQESKAECGGTSTDAHHCTGISDVILEEEVIHMAWLGMI